MSLSVFSQTDTTKVKIKPEYARLAIKDIIRGDGAQEEVIETQRKVITLEQITKEQGNVIVLLETKNTNSESVINLQQQQLVIYQDLSKSYERDIRKLKTKVVLWKVVGIGAIVGSAFLLIQ